MWKDRIRPTSHYAGAVAVVLGASLMGAAGACRKEQPPAPAAPAVAPKPAAGNRIEMTVTDEGFVPDRVAARAGAPVVLAITRKTDKTCAREILFQGQEGKTDLPLDKTVEITYTPKVAGTVKFGCAMGMMIGGVLAVTD